MTNIDSFDDRTTLKCDCIVGMNLENRKWSAFNEIELVIAVWDVDEDLLSNFEFVFDATAIGSDEACVDKGLSILGECEDIGDERYVEEHIAVKNEGTGRKISESGNGVAAEGMHCSTDGVVDE